MSGNAIVPKIVPLNTDPVPAGAEGTSGPLMLHPVAPGSPAGGPRPLPRLAPSLGLPGLDLLRDVPQGFGYRAGALPGGNGGVSVGPELTAYAGRYRPDTASTAVQTLPDATVGRTQDQLDALLAADPGRCFGPLVSAGPNAPVVSAEGIGLPDAARGDGAARVLGRKFGLNVLVTNPASGAELRADPAALAPVIAALCLAAPCPGADQPATDLQAALQFALWQGVDAMTHRSPDAFGPVPVKPTADPISQATHGLFGAIDVLPVGWAAVDGVGLTCDAAPAERLSALLGKPRARAGCGSGKGLSGRRRRSGPAGAHPRIRAVPSGWPEPSGWRVHRP